MLKGSFLLISIAALSACGGGSTSTPRGVGFDDYAQFELARARREAELSAPRSVIPASQVNSIPAQPETAIAAPLTAPVQPGSIIAPTELAAAGIGQAGAVQPTLQPIQTPVNTGVDPNRTQGLDASPANAAPVIFNNNAGISDEQNFDAVSGRETIQSDAERRAAQAAAREQVQPTAVPQRPSSTGPNIVEYAISAPNVKGQEWYSRSLLSGVGRFQRNCASYASPDEAQRDFLERGGPERDRRGIDPDGDGFACGWDPAPFKSAAGQ